MQVYKNKLDKDGQSLTKTVTHHLIHEYYENQDTKDQDTINRDTIDRDTKEIDTKNKDAKYQVTKKIGQERLKIPYRRIYY